MKDKKKIMLLISLLAIVAVVGIYFFLKYQTYDYAEITTVFQNDSTENSDYRYCLNGVLKYSRDGVALLTEKGEEIWNQPCQMSNPSVVVCRDSVAVGDKGGTSILVCQKNGRKGEIQTTKPIEKFVVSSQGIVSAILKDDEMPLVMCYDAVGNILVEHKVIPKNMGYPIDIALSADGNTLLVSYLGTEGNEVVTKVSYYYFGGQNEQKDYQVYQKDFKNEVVPVTAFLKDDLSLLVSDRAVIIYKGLQEPEEVIRVSLDTEIQSVAYSEHLIAVLLQKENATGYRLHIYNVKGKLLSSVDVNKEYGNLRIVNKQVILYDGQACSIYMQNGLKKYEGSIEQNIMEIFKLGSLNKYMVINANGFHEVRLAK